MRDPQPRPYAVRAEPSAADRKRLLAVQRWLAERVGGPIFEPHVTLCSGRAAPDAPIAARLTDVAAGRAPFRTALGDASGTDDLFTALFVRVTVPTALLEVALRAFPGSHAPRVGPHVSLTHADRSSAGTVRWRNPRGRLPATVTFAHLAIVRLATGSWRNVTRWERVASARSGRPPGRDAEARGRRRGAGPGVQYDAVR
jgi:hypothetical protein